MGCFWSRESTGCPQTGSPEFPQEGRQEGLQKAEAREAAKMTLRQLITRCGSLTDATTAQIQALPLQQLEALADALFDFQGPADLAAWLARRFLDVISFLSLAGLGSPGSKWISAKRMMQASCSNACRARGSWPA